MAGRKEPLATLPHKEVSTPMGGPLRDLPHHFSARLPPPTTANMENPRHLPCFSLIYLSGNSRTQAELCKPCPTPLLLAQDLSTVSDSIMSFQPPSLADNATFFMLLFSNNHPLSLNWNDSHCTKRMSLFKVSFAFSITCLQLRFT